MCVGFSKYDALLSSRSVDECGGNHRKRERRHKEVWNLVQWQGSGLHRPGIDLRIPVFLFSVLLLRVLVSPPSARSLTHLFLRCDLVQAPTLEIKVAWLTEIRKILTNQLKLRQGFYHCVDFLLWNAWFYFIQHGLSSDLTVDTLIYVCHGQLICSFCGVQLFWISYRPLSPLLFLRGLSFPPALRQRSLWQVRVSACPHYVLASGRLTFNLVSVQKLI